MRATHAITCSGDWTWNCSTECLACPILALIPSFLSSPHPSCLQEQCSFCITVSREFLLLSILQNLTDKEFASSFWIRPLSNAGAVEIMWDLGKKLNIFFLWGKCKSFGGQEVGCYCLGRHVCTLSWQWVDLWWSVLIINSIGLKSY